MKKLSFTVTNYNVCIWPLCMLGEMLFYQFYRFGGPDFGGLQIGEWRNRINRWALDRIKYDEVARFYLKRLNVDPKWYKEAMKEIPRKCSELISFTSKMFSTNLERLNNKKLYNLYREYQKKFTEMYLYGWLPNAPEGMSDLLTEKLGGVLKRRLKKLEKEEKRGEYLSILITPIEDSLRRKESKDFLGLLKKVKKGLAREDKLLEGHWQKYAWLPFDYDGPAWKKDYFSSLLASMLKQNLDPDQELSKLEREKNSLRKKQKGYIKELGLNKKEKELFKISRELMYWKDYRKDILFQSYYHMDRLILEIARRLGLSPFQVKHILPGEMRNALINKKVDADELNKRIRYSVLVYGRKGIKIYTGEKAEAIRKTFVKEDRVSKKINELHGECAYPGRSEGKAKIINTQEDVSRMKKGDILVSVATNPNLLVAMKVAGAIVTDKGGITCHAAIISRELKIPCLIGTKIATKVLKDGDLVEVDADKGKIKKL